MNEKNTPTGNQTIVVVGGGISGITTALEIAEVGYDVFLIEKNPYLGGRVSQLNQYFPKLCPPTCGLEINFRRIKNNPKIKVFTLAEVTKVEGEKGNYDVSIKISPRFINEKCTCCGDCVDACDTEFSNEFNFGINTRKGAYLPLDMAFPQRFVLDSNLSMEEKKKCADACKYNAIDPEMGEKTIDIKAGAIVWATGWKPYDAKKITNLGFGRYDNIITNMMLERLASTDGPTEGKILRPSDNNAPQTIAFAQCAGSRDEKHLPYCSYICCMASLKHATYIRAQYPDTKIYIFYIDLRAPGYKYEKFYQKLKEDENVFFIKGKVAEVEEIADGGIKVIAEDALEGKKVEQKVDMLVLATGMEPSLAGSKPNVNELKFNEDSFIINDFENNGMFAAGCANKPADVVSSNQNATGMALKAIQTIVGR